MGFSSDSLILHVADARYANRANTNLVEPDAGEPGAFAYCEHSTPEPGGLPGSNDPDGQPSKLHESLLAIGTIGFTTAGCRSVVSVQLLHSSAFNLLVKGRGCQGLFNLQCDVGAAELSGHMAWHDWRLSQMIFTQSNSTS